MLMWRFLKGSKRFFFISMLCAALAALADMISPQIIRAAIDNAIGGKPAEFPAWVMRGVDAIGGFSFSARLSCGSLIVSEALLISESICGSWRLAWWSLPPSR